MKISEMKKILKSKGLFCTKARIAILSVLSKSRTPVNVEEIHHLLVRKKIMVDISTIYREISTLQNSGFIEECTLQASKKRYQIHTQSFVAHCTDCNKISPLSKDIQNEIKNLEKKISKENEFQLTTNTHLHGKCIPCKSKSQIHTSQI